jgi:tetratricopeptide (TPR) repeat protein
LHYHALSRGRSTLLRNLLRHLWQQAWRSTRPDGARQAQLPETANLRQRFDALMQADDVDGALALAAAASARDTAWYEARLLMGRAHQKLHQPERALDCYEAARRLRDDDAELYDSRASTYQELGRLPEAFADYERALALRPDFPLALFHRSMARLLAGDFRRGWDDYELRRLNAEHATSEAGLPRWDGSPLAGRTLLITREQGLGDEIMYASMLPQLIAQAGRCIVECDPRLLDLLRRSFPAATFFGTVPGSRLPASIARSSIDFAIEAGSLAGFLRREAADFPRHSGYLRADAAATARWRERLAGLGPGRRIGISWTGGVRKTRRALRSLTLEQLLPLLRIPGLRFVSLQYTADARQAVDDLRLRHGIDIAHWQEAIEDYDQTAALVSALDLTISVCTSIVHLGGALGRPVWVLAPLSPEWRYGTAGETMIWYPSVRMFRQSAYGDWAPVIERVAGELAAERRNAANSVTADGSE